LQRTPSVAVGRWVLGAWQEAVIGSCGNATASMTGIEGAAVIQRGSRRLPSRLAVEYQRLEGPNSRRRPDAGMRLADG